MKKIILISILILMTSLTFGQSLHNEIQSIYNFHPHNLSDQKLEEKSKELDIFWNKITANKGNYLDTLRIELKDTTNSSFFGYDCGHLLLSISKTNLDYEIALNSMLRADLDDIQRLDYIKTMNDFAVKGYNTTIAGLKIIQAKKFKAFVPQHSLEIDKTIALQFILLPIQTELYVDKVVEELKKIKDTSTIKNILLFLDYTCNCKADSIISSFCNDNTQEPCVRNYATLIKSNNSKIRRATNQEKYLELAEKRKKILSRISDEALDELYEITDKMKGRYNCH